MIRIPKSSCFCHQSSSAYPRCLYICGCDY